MNMLFLELLFIFLFGAVSGWFIEVFYRSYVQRKLINPGFLIGPYVPIYGFGVLLLYGISLLELGLTTKVLIFTVLATFLELITGIIFTSYYNIRLWDYTKEKFNYKGHISLKYSTYWAILGFLFYVIFADYLSYFILYLDSILLIFFLGLFYGIFIVDVFKSLKIAYRLKIIVTKLTDDKLPVFKLNYESLKQKIEKQIYSVKEISFFQRFFFSFDNVSKSEIVSQINSFFDDKRSKIKNSFEKRKEDVKNFLNKKK